MDIVQLPGQKPLTQEEATRAFVLLARTAEAWRLGLPPAPEECGIHWEAWTTGAIPKCGGCGSQLMHDAAHGREWDCYNEQHIRQRWVLANVTPGPDASDTGALAAMPVQNAAPCQDCADYAGAVERWFDAHRDTEIPFPHPTWEDIAREMDLLTNGETLRKRCQRHAKQGHEVASLSPRRRFIRLLLLVT